MEEAHEEGEREREAETETETEAEAEAVKVKVKAKVCVLLLCGLPGAGKSTLARKLKHFVELLTPSTRRSAQVSVVCFDDVGDQVAKRECGKDEYEPAVWKSGRIEALSKLESELCTSTSTLAAEQKENEKESKQLVIVDDNMQLRSMRREVYILARKYRTDFVILHLAVSLPEALKRNAGREREGRVPEHVLHKMHSSFESPDGTQHKWEAKTIALDALEDIDLEKVWNELLHRLWSVAVDDYHSPDSQNERRMEGQQINARSSLYQLDQRLRKALSAAVASWKSGDPSLSGDALREKVAKAGKEKKRILEEKPEDVDLALVNYCDLLYSL